MYTGIYVCVLFVNERLHQLYLTEISAELAEKSMEMGWVPITQKYLKWGKIFSVEFPFGERLQGTYQTNKIKVKILKVTNSKIVKKKLYIFVILLDFGILLC